MPGRWGRTQIGSSTVFLHSVAHEVRFCDYLVADAAEAQIHKHFREKPHTSTHKHKHTRRERERENDFQADSGIESEAVQISRNFPRNAVIGA
jgi:hypothetical protein